MAVVVLLVAIGGIAVGIAAAPSDDPRTSDAYLKLSRERDNLDSELADVKSDASAQRDRLEDAESRLARAEATVEALEGELSRAAAATEQVEADAQTNVSDLEARLAGLEDEVETLEGQLEGARSQQAAAEAAAEDSAALAQQLLVTYDSQIRAAVSEFAATTLDVACRVGQERAESGLSSGTVQAAAVTLEVFGQLPGITELGLDLSTLGPTNDEIEAEAERCFEETFRAIELTAPKGSGFYTVGDEIAPGRWRSTGTGSSCYWARLDVNQNLLDNHFGNAGGTVTIRSSDEEVQFDDCGTWEYLGP